MSDNPPSTEPIVYCWNSIYPYELLNACKALSHSQTGEIILEGAYYTVDVPPAKKDGFAICRDIHNKKWVHVPDHRGQSYWLENMRYDDPGLPIVYPGELPAGAKLYPPKKPYEVLRNELAVAIRKKKRDLRNAGVIVDGILFDSDQGSEFAYRTFIRNAEESKNPMFSKRWRASNQKWIDMTLELAVRVYGAVNENTDRVFSWYEDKERALSSTENEQLESFYV